MEFIISILIFIIVSTILNFALKRRDKKFKEMIAVMTDEEYEEYLKFHSYIQRRYGYILPDRYDK